MYILAENHEGRSENLKSLFESFNQLSDLDLKATLQWIHKQGESFGEPAGGPASTVCNLISPTSMNSRVRPPNRIRSSMIDQETISTGKKSTRFWYKIFTSPSMKSMRVMAALYRLNQSPSDRGKSIRHFNKVL